MTNALEAGIYKTVDGEYGYLSKSGEFTQTNSRELARSLARDEEVSTTPKGVYEAPESVVPVPTMEPVSMETETKTRKPYTYHHFASITPGVFQTVEDPKEAQTFYMAAFMYRRKHPEFQFSVKRENGVSTFTRL